LQPTSRRRLRSEHQLKGGCNHFRRELYLLLLLPGEAEAEAEAQKQRAREAAAGIGTNAET